MPRRVGSKAGAVVKRGAGGRFMGSVSVGGASFGTGQGRIKMRGSGLSLGQLRQSFKSTVEWGAGTQGGRAPHSRSYMQTPQKASNTLASIKRTPGMVGSNPAHQKQWAVNTAIGARAYSRAYRKVMT
jgi:hypothetical protein